MAAIDLNTLRSTIEDRVETELKSTPPVKVIFQNVPYVPTPNSSWVQCLISYGANSYKSLGGTSSSTNQIIGSISLNIFSPKGIGIKSNLAIATRLRNLFNRIIVSDVNFDAPIGPEIFKKSDPEGYFQTQIRVTFDIYESL